MACLQRITQSPADDLAGIQIRDKRQIANAFLCLNVGYVELRLSLRNFESQNEYGYKPCIKRRFQNAKTLQSRNQKNSS